MTIFEPNVHPILVHFSFALGISAALAYVVCALAPESPRMQRLHHAANWMLGISAVAIVLTVAAGFQAYYSVAHDGPSHAAMTIHRNWALFTAICVLALATWRWGTRGRRLSKSFAAAATLCAVLLGITGWWGGTLVYQYGLGVQNLPMASGDGHDHAEHAHDEPATGAAVETTPRAQDAATSNAVDGQRQPIDLADPDAVAQAFSHALNVGDAARLRELSTAELVVAESGRAERSFDEYANHHMPSDFAFSRAVSSELKRRDVMAGEQMYTVVSESQIHGRYKDKPVHEQLLETMVLQRTDAQWRVAHIHWSSSPITGEHEH